MKDVSIFIVNFNRFSPVKMLVEAFLKRNYKNITILDNASEYQPLLEWYKSCGVKVHHIGSNQGPYILDRLPEYYPITKTQHYVYTDADCVPIDENPENFIEDIIELSKKYNIPKIGLGIKIDDLPDCNKYKKMIITHESVFWHKDPIKDERCILYKAPTDSTFAINAPGIICRLNNDIDYRSGFPYMIRHMPWYYDTNNLPEDEKLLKATKLHHIGHWSSMQ
jgi:hypothetical protein